jgi:membrane-associated protease RseP (regulator of RpoE activity)
VPEIDSDSGLIAAWRVEAINTHRLGIDLGLRVGDRILAIDDVPVQETESFMGRLNQLADAGFYSIDLLDEQGQHIVVMVAVADGADCS